MGQRCVQQVAEYWQGWNLIFRFHCEEVISPKGMHADVPLTLTLCVIIIKQRIVNTIAKRAHTMMRIEKIL